MDTKLELANTTASNLWQQLAPPLGHGPMPKAMAPYGFAKNEFKERKLVTEVENSTKPNQSTLIMFGVRWKCNGAS